MNDVLARFRTRNVESDPLAQKTRAKKSPFAPVPLDEAAPYFRAARSASGALVVVLLFYMAWKTKSRTFSLPNRLFAQYGVRRWTKLRALHRLKRAGLIETRQTGQQAVVVTLL